MARKVASKSLFMVLSVFLIFLIVFLLNITRTAKEYKKTNYTSVASVEEHGLTILLWNTFFEDSRWTLANDTIHFQCPLADCIVTNQHDYLPSLLMYDAIVLHAARKFPYFNSVPPIRTARQLYVFAVLESPLHTQHDMTQEADFYNLTLTYRLDSDIVWSYAQVLDVETNAAIAPNLNPAWRAFNATWLADDAHLWQMIKRKKKLIAWFVSNCHSPSKRENLVKEMQKYVPIDVYGDCGVYSCLRFNAACDELLDNDYKFYLSFENSLCQDYVTEKLFNALNRNLVPIVYGGANYTKFAPPHSYIDVQSFASIRQLTDYLQYLAENPDKYAEYFWWRKYYKISTTLVQFPGCDLCQHISKQSMKYHTQSYTDIQGYWHNDMCTDKPRIEF